MSLRSFIPNRISNRRVVLFLDRLSKMGRSMHIGWRRSDARLEDNRARMSGGNTRYRGKGPAPGVAHVLLEHQNSYGHIPFGRVDMAYAGCEVIAVYNALISLGYTPDLAELIHDFEHDGMVLHGRFGTSPLALCRYLEKYLKDAPDGGPASDRSISGGDGSRTKYRPDQGDSGSGMKTEYTYDPDGFDDLADRSRVCILTMYNDRRDIFAKVHTVCVTRDGRGYTAHNTYCDGRLIGPASTLSGLLDMINGGHARGIMLLGII